MKIAAVLTACSLASVATAEPSARFCATRRYAAASAESSSGPTLWVAEFEAEHPPRVRQVRVPQLPRELACGDGAVYLRTETAVSVADLGVEDLVLQSGPNWSAVQRARKHVAGKLRPGYVHQLPDPAFVLAFTKARRGHGDTSDETRALFLVGPRRETLVFSVRDMVLVLD